MPSPPDRRRSSANLAPIPAFFLYGEAPQPPDERTVHVETIAARSRLHDWNIAAHRHRDLHQILIIRRGRVDVRIDDRSILLRAPAVVVVPPGSVHAFAFQEHTAGIVVSFAAGLASDLASRTGGGLEFLSRSAATALARAEVEATDIAELADMLLREFGRSALGREHALRGLLGALLANVLRVTDRGEADAGSPAARERELVARFRHAIERRYRAHEPIAVYARELDVSETRLRRACLAAVGQPPVALVHLRMLIEAKRQLRYTATPVAQIAYFLGFEDPAYFTRFFTQRAGMSPRAFRQRDVVR